MACFYFITEAVYLATNMVKLNTNRFLPLNDACQQNYSKVPKLKGFMMSCPSSPDD